MYTYIRMTHTYVYIHTYIHTCIRIYIHTHIHTYDTYLHTYMHTSMHAYVCIHACKHTYIHILQYLSFLHNRLGTVFEGLNCELRHLSRALACSTSCVCARMRVRAAYVYISRCACTPDFISAFFCLQIRYKIRVLAQGQPNVSHT